MRRSEPAFGYRIDYKGRSVVISGDTKYSDELVAAAKDADVLLHEALQPVMVAQMRDAAAAKGQPHIAKVMGDILDYHASPEDAARAATAANAKGAGALPHRAASAVLVAGCCFPG